MSMPAMYSICHVPFASSHAPALLLATPDTLYCYLLPIMHKPVQSSHRTSIHLSHHTQSQQSMKPSISLMKFCNQANERSKASISIMPVLESEGEKKKRTKTKIVNRDEIVSDKRTPG
ncbi:hypothetical protein DL98DRAFT_294889 [Cadophora sp. DSE1049]|nr:hypothetical protein DL98DRAFT_294889 [Cadophora sp. DSE1049]